MSNLYRWYLQWLFRDPFVVLARAHKGNLGKWLKNKVDWLLSMKHKSLCLLVCKLPKEVKKKGGNLSLIGWTKCRCVLYTFCLLQFITNWDVCKAFTSSAILVFCGCAAIFNFLYSDCPLMLFVKCTNQSNINLTFVLTMRFMLKGVQCVKSWTFQTSEGYW